MQQPTNKLYKQTNKQTKLYLLIIYCVYHYQTDFCYGMTRVPSPAPTGPIIMGFAKDTYSSDAFVISFFVALPFFIVVLAVHCYFVANRAAALKFSEMNESGDSMSSANGLLKSSTNRVITDKKKGLTDGFHNFL